MTVPSYLGMKKGKKKNMETTQEEESPATVQFFLYFSLLTLKLVTAMVLSLSSLDQALLSNLSSVLEEFYSIYKNCMFSVVGLKHVKGILLFGPPGNI